MTVWLASVVEDELWWPSEDSARSSVVTDDSEVVSTVVSVCSEVVADEDAISVASEVAEDEEADCVVSDDSETGANPFISSIK